MAALRAAKQALRKEIKKRGETSAVSYRYTKAENGGTRHKAAASLLKHPKYERCRRIAVFLSMNDEVRTEDIIEDIFKRGKECFIPRYFSDSSHMDMLKLASVEDIRSLPLTSWNIRQPGDEEEREDALASGGLELILMPGLGFDKNGHRLGRGKGFYDTYLQRCMNHSKGKPYTIGLAFKEQICQEVPVEGNDIHIDEVLYEGM